MSSCPLIFYRVMYYNTVLLSLRNTPLELEIFEIWNSTIRKKTMFFCYSVWQWFFSCHDALILVFKFQKSLELNNFQKIPFRLSLDNVSLHCWHCWPLTAFFRTHVMPFFKCCPFFICLVVPRQLCRWPCWDDIFCWHLKMHPHNSYYLVL